jgi:hypothetical protein
MSSTTDASRSPDATAAGGSAGSGEPSLTYEEWLALDCDCTAERPCPMLCGGVGFTLVGDVELPARDMCQEINPALPCPDGTGYKCGAVANGEYELIMLSSVTFARWHTATTLEQTGWEIEASFGAGGSTPPQVVRVCGGVVPDCTVTGSDSCSWDPEWTTCQCPRPPCDGPCPNWYRCNENADCLSGICDTEGGPPGFCRVPPTCFDSVMNGPETDVDCGGGGICPGCSSGMHCMTDADCWADGRCDGGSCA